MKDDDQGIGLQQVLAQIRKDLLASEKSVGKDEALLKVKSVEVDLTVVTKKEGSAGVKLWVVNIGGKYDKELTHTIKVNLVPKREIDPALH